MSKGGAKWLTGLKGFFHGRALMPQPIPLHPRTVVHALLKKSTPSKWCYARLHGLRTHGGDLFVSELATGLGGALLDPFRFGPLAESKRRVKKKSMPSPRQANSKRGSNMCRVCMLSHPVSASPREGKLVRTITYAAGPQGDEWPLRGTRGHGL